MKKHEAMSVGDIIKQAISQTGHADDFDRQRACYLWAEVVGPTINSYTTRRWVDGDALHVFLTSAPLKQELSFHKERLAQLINERVGRNIISRIIIH